MVIENVFAVGNGCECIFTVWWPSLVLAKQCFNVFNTNPSIIFVNAPVLIFRLTVVVNININPPSACRRACSGLLHRAD